MLQSQAGLAATYLSVARTLCGDAVPFSLLSSLRAGSTSSIVQNLGVCIYMCECLCFHFACLIILSITIDTINTRPVRKKNVANANRALSVLSYETADQSVRFWK